MRNALPALPLVLMLAACGGGGEDSAVSSDPAPTPPPAAAPAPIAAAPTPPAPTPAAPAPRANPPAAATPPAPVQTPAPPAAQPTPGPAPSAPAPVVYDFNCWDRGSVGGTIRVYHDATEYPWKTIRIEHVSGYDFTVAPGQTGVRLRDDPDGSRRTSGTLIQRTPQVFATNLPPPRGTVYEPIDPAVYDRPWPTAYFFRTDQSLEEVRLEWANQGYSSNLRCRAETAPPLPPESSMG